MHYLAALILQSQLDPAAAQRMAMTILAIMPIFILIGLAIILVPCWFICKKAGFSPWLSLLNIIPLGNLVLLYILAFGEWKVVPVQQVAWPPQPPPPMYPPQV
jgi:uncharacterized membrane protein